jgi:dissimilatory sulfite reductase (desulfoviridin) alpha/beta subunit
MTPQCSISSKAVHGPAFVTGLKRLAKDNDYMTDLMGQLEHSYKTRKGYWKGGTVGVFGYGGGVIPRFSEVAEMFPASKEFHTLRIQPPAGMHYDTDVLRKMCDIWEKHGSGLIAFHGQSGDIMFQGASTANVQGAFDELNELGFDLGGAGPLCAPRCLASVPRAASSRALTKPVHIVRWSTPSWTICTARHCPTSSSSSSRAAPTTA